MKTNIYSTKSGRLYAPMQHQGARWVRCQDQHGLMPAMPLQSARGYYQSLLLARAFGGQGPTVELRAVHSTQLVEFFVGGGYGPLPSDMLRYDQAVETEDVGAGTFLVYALDAPTVDRWRSFGWTVSFQRRIQADSAFVPALLYPDTASLALAA